MINPIFSNKYNEETFAEFIYGIVPSLSLDKKRSEVRTGFKSIQQIAEASENKLDLVVFIAKLESSLNARVEITKNTYTVLKNHARSNALVAYISDDSTEWRLSLITTKVTRTKDGVKESISNPRRFSYVLGPNAKVATPSKMLQGIIASITDLENKFSLAVVSKEFFTQIATQYSKLVGGTRGEGRKAVIFERTLKLGNTDDAINANFAIRLIGRLVFCWFLKQKKGHLNNPLIPPEVLSVSAVKTIGDYYHSVCIPLFFEVLNKPQPSRPTFFSYSELFDKIPFLNGGLFQDHTEDNHKFNCTTGMSERRGVVNVPDIWFSELFQIFEEYNFTIDENTSIDTELSIDPEMLGRIFENLLAEVNPETGASARKSTGSFYTPREIVDFMVEESLIAHLKTKTNISEEKLRALSSYNLDDDVSNPIDQKERKLLVETIHNTTVLDPACGSGAFPIGILQRLVHILGVLDPECSMYLNKFPPEARRMLQKHDRRYVRKLSVIRECIHGVDIQPIAIDISRLRCFLTLVVDQQVDDNAPNRGIEPLPNLDFKFVCANTLIKSPVHEGPLFGDEFAVALGELIDEYFAPVDQLHKLETARKLQQLISDKTKKELENILKSYSYVKDEKFKKVLAQKNEKSDTERVRINNLWGSYENIFQNKPVGFFDTRYFFPAVYRQGGFDIIIANPPYISFYSKQSQANKSELDNLRLFIKEFSFIKDKKKLGRFNTLMFFIEKGLKLLKPNSILNYIVDTSIHSNPSRDIREYITVNSKILKIVDNLREFENVASSQAILLIQNIEQKSTDKILWLKYSNGTFNIERTGIKEEINELNDFSFKVPGENADLRIVNKFKKNQTLSNLVGNKNIRTSITFTGQKNRFIVNKPTLDIDYPLAEGSQGVSFPYSPIKYSTYIRYDLVLRDKLNAEYLGNAKKENKRSPMVIGLGNLNSFKSPKIFIRLSDKRVTASYSDQIICADLSLYILTLPNLKSQWEQYSLKYLLGLLNSNFVTYFFLKNNYIRNINTGTPQIRLKDLRNMPIPILKSNNIYLQKEIELLVDKILAITKSDDYLENPAKKEELKKYEKQIDQLVYKLYDLEPEEIEIVENSSKK